MKSLSSLRLTLIIAAVGALSALPTSGFACSVCFGDPASPLVQGAKNGVIFLAVVIYAVLFTMAGIAFYWYRRAKALSAAEQTAPAGDLGAALPSES